jgi:hypothetical protein
MKAKLALALLAALGIAVVTPLAISQTPASPQPSPAAAGEDSPPDMAAMMEAWMKTMRPGRGHQRLEPFVGKWDTVTKTWWGGPGSQAMENKGEQENTMVLGGRYLQSVYKGTTILPDDKGGMQSVPYEGMGLIGYDNYRKMYVGNWAHTMGTDMLIMRGAFDPAGKVLTFYGEMDEPMLGIVGRMVKYAFRVLDEDRYVFEVYDLHAGPEYKVSEITYTRKK